MPELTDIGYSILKSYYLEKVGMSEEFARFFAERDYLASF